jgi:hypothetical protein
VIPFTIRGATTPGAGITGPGVEFGVGSALVASPTIKADAPGAIAMDVSETVIVGPPGRSVWVPMM